VPDGGAGQGACCCGVVVAVLPGVDFRQGGEGFVGDDGGDGDLGDAVAVFGLVPGDGEVDQFEQARFERGRQFAQDVAEVGQFIEQGRVDRLRLVGGQGGELGFGAGALGVQFGEPGGDAGTYVLASGPGGDAFQGGDLGVLLCFQLPDLDP
jgi:hypothetical protein